MAVDESSRLGIEGPHAVAVLPQNCCDYSQLSLEARTHARDR